MRSWSGFCSRKYDMEVIRHMETVAEYVDAEALCKLRCSTKQPRAAPAVTQGKYK